MVMLSAAMWGLSGVCGQFLFENYHPYPVWLIAVRQVAAGILFLLFMRIKGDLSEKLCGYFRQRHR